MFSGKAKVLLFVLSCFILQSRNAMCGQYTVGAHYYAWYGGKPNPHWPLGSSHEPWLGYYSSSDPGTVTKQIDIATRYGIDVFVVGWTGIGTPEEAKFKAGFLKASNLKRIRFCMVYDSSLRLRKGFDFNDPEVSQLFISDVVYLAKQYFKHPSYFQIDGRPVLKIYLARAYRGDFPSALQEIRRQLKPLGYDPYLIADSLSNSKNDLYIAAQFDAATTYNIYSSSLPGRGIKTTGALADSIRPRFWNSLYLLNHIRVAGRNVPVDFQPGVIPQYDDRKARGTNVPVLAQSKNDVKEMFQVAKEILDAKTSGHKIVWITSWNEWHEGTSIEPTVSQGKKYPGGNFGFDFLEAVSEVFQ